MADNAFDRTIINARERPISSDINQEQSQSDRTLRQFLVNYFGGKSGFVRTGFEVTADGVDLTVDVNSGIGFILDLIDVPVAIDGVTGLDDRSVYKPVYLEAGLTFVVPAAPAAPDTRIDIVEVKIDRRTENTLSRDVLNTGTGVFNPTSVKKTLAFSLDGRNGTVTTPAPSTAGLSYKVGIAANPGVEPPVTAGYTKVAVVNVDSDVLIINAADVDDARVLLGPANEERILLIAAADAEPVTAAPFTLPLYTGVVGAGSWASVTAAGSSLVEFAIPLLAGDRISKIRLYGREGNLAGEFYTMNLHEVDPATGGTANLGGVTSGVTGVDTFIDLTTALATIPITLKSDKLYVLSCGLASTSVAAEVLIYGMQVTYDRPQGT